MAVPPDNPMTEEGVALGPAPVLRPDPVGRRRHFLRELPPAGVRLQRSGTGQQRRRRQHEAELDGAGQRRLVAVAVLGRPRRQPGGAGPAGSGEPRRDGGVLGERRAQAARAPGVPRRVPARLRGRPDHAGQRRTGDRPVPAHPRFRGGEVRPRSRRPGAVHRGRGTRPRAVLLRARGLLPLHGTLLFTDGDFHNTGLDEAPADSGRAAVTGRRLDYGKFKSPSLRNVEYTLRTCTTAGSRPSRRCSTTTTRDCT